MTIDQLYNAYSDSNGVSTDTRSIEDGQLYFALKGPRFNGNAHAQSALDKGASYAVIDEPKYQVSDRYILVEDVLTHLQALASYHRSKYRNPVIGITGSNGKTTTKELIHTILSTKYDVNTTKGNYNNHIGVPLTILNGDLRQDMWLIEMGTNAPGEIEFLSKIATPNYGLITNIGAAHLEKLKDLKGVFREKTSLFRQVLNDSGLVFINQDDQNLARFEVNDSRWIEYGANSCAYGELSLVSSSPFLALRLKDYSEDYLVSSNLVGLYNQVNISAALTLGSFFDIDIKEAVSAISSYEPDNMRSQMIKTQSNKIIVDSYNANPSSMQESITSFASTDFQKPLLILGDMLELGEQSGYYHKKLLEIIDQLGLNYILVGEQFKSINQKAYPDVDTLKGDILNRKVLIENSVVLLKGSRSVRLEKLLEVL